MRESDWNRILRDFDIASRTMRQLRVGNNPILNGSLPYPRSMKNLQRTFDALSPSVSLLRKQSKILGIGGTDMISGFAQIQDLSRPAMGMSGIFDPNLLKSLYSSSRKMSDDFSKMSAIAGSLKDLSPNFNIFQDPAVQSLSSLVRSLENFSNVANDPAMAIVFKQLRELELGDESLEAVVGQIESEMTTQIEALPQGRISHEGMSSNNLAVVLFLIGIIFSYYLSCNSTRELKDHIDDQFNKSREIEIQQIMVLRTSLQELTDNLIIESEEGVFYVVQRTVHLREKPVKKSMSLGLLYPNQRVKLLQRRHKWIQIEYFNYQESKIDVGWVFKKCLKMEH